MARVKFRDRLQRSFLGYAAWIVAVIVALYLGGFLLNAYTVVIRGCRQGSREAETFLSAQLESYTGGMETLAKQPELLAAAGGRQESRTDANRLLYDFANRQTLRSYFLLLSPEAKIVCSNFSLSNQKIMEESAFLGRVLSRAEKGQVLGSVTLKSGDTVLAEVPLVAECGVEKLTWGQIFKRTVGMLWMAE